MTRRTVRATVAVAAALLVLLAGCGVPRETDVKVAGPGLSPAPPAGADPPGVPAQRKDARTPTQLVEFFLSAVVGDPGGAEQRTRDYFTVGQQENWKPGNKVNVVRYEPDDDLIVTPEKLGYSVDLNVRQVGVLDPDTGVIEPATETTTVYHFRILYGSDSSLFLADWKTQQHLLLSTIALSRYYLKRNLYFWAGGGASLVPDLRYLPTSVDVKEQPTRLVKWLLEGPSSWLRPGVDEMPDNVVLQGNVTSPDGSRLEVNLSAPDIGKDATQVDRLAAQLRWSLGQYTAVVLKIDGQEKKVGTAYQPLVTELPTTPDRFAILNGVVRPLVPPGAEPPPSSPVLDAEANTKVLRAAVARMGEDYAIALVRRSGNRQRLWIGWRKLDGTVEFRALANSYQSIGRPQWLPGRAGEAGVVIADGALYRFDRATGDLVEIETPGRVTAMAVAPDGHRIALVIGDRLMVAPTTGDQNELRGIGQPLALPTKLTHLAGAGWSQQNLLVAAGQLPSGQTGFTEITVDGAEEEQRGRELGNTKITQLVAFPDNSDTDASWKYGALMYESDRSAFQVTGTVFEPISVSDVQPGGKLSSAPPTAEQTPTAPFFLDE
ncbi:LpqB family beta-propeller domain-containing protein [Rhizomonospora bruguierae]|uniref:LpqB family beta-propeller domain-containing protein n=1 Tax=Rhizomonospora bruguierae TaxID=1581705 RepID=UPI001BCEC34F|nr:LpqB family beta-propeller domain-containing protein [Micromonospora sp. NBRC 107566]